MVHLHSLSKNIHERITSPPTLPFLCLSYTHTHSLPSFFPTPLPLSLSPPPPHFPSLSCSFCYSLSIPSSLSIYCIYSLSIYLSLLLHCSAAVREVPNKRVLPTWKGIGSDMVNSELNELPESENLTDRPGLSRRSNLVWLTRSARASEKSDRSHKTYHDSPLVPQRDVRSHKTYHDP